MKVRVIPRPDCVEDDHLEWLDELRESGLVNMCGGAFYVRAHFDLPADKAMTIFQYWTDSFGERHGHKFPA